MTEDIRHKFNRLTFYTLLFTFLGISMTFIIFSSVASPTVTCPLGQAVSQIGTASDKCITTTDQISFDSSAVGNSSAFSPTQIATLSNAIQGEMIVAVLASQSLVGGVSVTDSLSDVFTPALTVRSSPDANLEIWTGFAGGTMPISVTATWNQTNPTLLMVASYKNAVGIGNKNFSQGAGITTSSFNITTTKNGSWIMGGAAVFPAVVVTRCQAITPGTGLVQRTNSCTGIGGAVQMWGDIEDNATVLRNQFIFTYSSSWVSTAGPPDAVLGAVELLPKDQEAQNPNFNNFCTTTNGLCITTQYALNLAPKNTAANALNQVLTLNQVYCTGITTVGLVLSGAHSVEMWGSYGAVSLNQTGAKLLIQFKIGVTAPSTTFASGVCAAGGQVEGTASIYFAISGSLSATNAFSTAVNGFCSNTGSPCNTAQTVYGWFEITPQNFVGHISFDQVVNQAYSTASIGMLEIK